jgi:hypothetical protein
LILCSQAWLKLFEISFTVCSQSIIELLFNMVAGSNLSASLWASLNHAHSLSPNLFLLVLFPDLFSLSALPQQRWLCQWSFILVLAYIFSPGHSGIHWPSSHVTAVKRYSSPSSVPHYSLTISNFLLRSNSFPPSSFPLEVSLSSTCPHFHVQAHCSSKVQTTRPKNALARTLSIQSYDCSVV